VGHDDQTAATSSGSAQMMFTGSHASRKRIQSF
jgi:hypothetical protein